MKKITIAIDGPAGAGKSTVAQLVAQRLNYIYIDTGAMYRAIAWKVLQEKITTGNTAAIIKVAENITIKLTYLEGKTKVFVDDRDVTAEIRDPKVTAMVSEVAQLAVARQAMVSLQRDMAAQGGVVMDGRDIGTHVLPMAEVKIFLTASIHERAERRWKEMKSKGFDVDLAELTNDIATRDKKDSERAISPLVQAADALLLDTTVLSIEQVVTRILEICEER